MFPVFFSVSSNDIGHAEAVWERLPDNWVYIYSKTGEEGVHMWDEIAKREIPQSKLFVVFWSKSYLKAQGCVRELLQAHELVKQGQLRSLVLRLDDFPISWKDEFGDSTKPVFDALKSMLDFRTSSQNIDSTKAFDLVQRVAEPFLKSDHPRFLRHDLQQALRNVVKKDRFTFYPAVWVSGFNGVGRESLIADLNRAFAPNGRAVVVEINEASLPKQTRLRIESEAFGTDQQRLRELNAGAVDDECTALADTIERVFAAGNFVILRQSRIVEESVDLPEWVDDVVNTLSPATRPKLFVVSQMPLLGERRNHCRESLVAQRVPTIDDHQIVDFCHQLIGYFDKNTKRWTDQEIDKITRASCGNIGFLVSLVRAAAGIEDFDEIDQLVAADSNSLTAAITVYVRWAFSQLRDFEDEQRALIFLNDISPCDISDLEKVLTPKRSILRVMGKLLELGLVEREGDNIYRLTPLLARRLNLDLAKPSLRSWHRSAIMNFIKKPIEIEIDEHRYLRIESRIQASLLVEGGDIPNNVLAFVSAAHWCQAGIRLYHARRRVPAYRLLRKAYESRLEFASASRVELTRYYCLSATRNRKYLESESCINILENVHSTKGMAAFLRADLLEHKRQFAEAIAEYKNSLELNKGNESRLERTYRPLVRCILASPRPDFALAERYAKKWLELRVTIFSLMAVARVYLHWKYHGVFHGREVPRDIDSLYLAALRQLENDPGVGGSHFELKAEEASFSGDFDGAVAYMDEAIQVNPRFELRSTRWRLMARSGVTDLMQRSLTELVAAKNNADFKSNWHPFLPALAETYARSLKGLGRPLGEVNAFATELANDEIGGIVARIKRSP
jgi:tetratricopeptide (TPR) repeat protein